MRDQVIGGVAAVAALVGGCSDQPPTGPVPGLGSNTVTRYVAIGNSLSAGYQSNALYAAAQQYSFPNLIAQQLRKAGAQLPAFEQPLYGDPGNPDTVTGYAARLEITDISGPVPTIASRPVAPGVPLNTALNRPYDNLGVPALMIQGFLDTTNAFANPFVDLVLRPAGGLPKSVFRQVQVLQPDLITFWLGNNDVLLYATTGGTLFPSPTPSGQFATLYAQALDTLRDILPNAKIIVGNIPDVTSIPYFTTIGPTLIAQGISSLWCVRSAGDTALLNLNTNLLTLLAQAPLGGAAGFARTNPLPNDVVLDSSEIAVCQTATNAYNSAIASAAAAKNAVLFDANSIFKKIQAEGYSVAGEVYTTAYLSGGLFSLDGVHPSSRGYAIVANELIKLMNSSFRMSVPLVDVSSIPGIPAPFKSVTSGGRLPVLSPEGHAAIRRFLATGMK